RPRARALPGRRDARRIGRSPPGQPARSVVREPLAGEECFVETEIPQVADPHRIENAAQVIDLVLHDARMEALDAALDGLAERVVTAIAQALEARDQSPHAG